MRIKGRSPQGLCTSLQFAIKESVDLARALHRRAKHVQKIRCDVPFDRDQVAEFGRRQDPEDPILFECGWQSIPDVRPHRPLAVLVENREIIEIAHDVWLKRIHELQFVRVRYDPYDFRTRVERRQSVAQFPASDQREMTYGNAGMTAPRALRGRVPYQKSNGEES